MVDLKIKGSLVGKLYFVSFLALIVIALIQSGLEDGFDLALITIFIGVTLGHFVMAEIISRVDRWLVNKVVD